MAEKIEINLVGVDSRTEAALKLIFSRHAKYVINHYADFAIIDAESIKGREYLIDKLKQNDILITVFPDKYQHAYILKKPINAKNLMSTIDTAIKDPDNSLVSMVEKTDSSELSPPKNEAVDHADSAEKSQTSNIDGYVANPFAKYSSEAFLKEHRAALEQEKVDREKIEADAKSIENEQREVDAVVNESGNQITENVKSLEERVADNSLYRDVKSYPIPTLQDKVNNKIFGQDVEIDINNIPAHLLYEADHYLYRYVIEAHYIALKEGKNVVVELDNDYIYLDIKNLIIYTSLPEGSLYALSLMPISQEVNVFAIDDGKEMGSIVRGHRLVYYSEYGWLIALMVLWSARGRLPDGFDVTQSYYLANDYGFFLGGLSIDEIKLLTNGWKDNESHSFNDIIDRNDVSHKIVISFFSLGLMLGLLESDHKEAIIRSNELQRMAGRTRGTMLPNTQELLDKASHGLDALLKELKDI